MQWGQLVERPTSERGQWNLASAAPRIRTSKLEELQTAFDFLREGDGLMVTRIDRLARKHRGSSGHRPCRPSARCLIKGDRAANRHQHSGRQVLPRHARRVRRVRDEPPARGDRKAKAAGVYKGRPASIDAPQVRATKAQGLGASEIVKAIKIGRESVYRVLETG
jgi:DNA invertase Pin-like site-specific DNA recombinase